MDATIFALFLCVSSSSGTECFPQPGGPYATREECEEIRRLTGAAADEETVNGERYTWPCLVLRIPAWSTNR